MNLVITICATRSYAYAMKAQARRAATAVEVAGVTGGHIVLVGDTSPELETVTKEWAACFPAGWEVHRIASSDFVEGGENYKSQAQLLIGAMRTEAFAAARKLRATQCWSLDSDTLPQPNALRVLRDTLAFDDGYYDVAMCPYPNDAFLGGRGTPQNPIAEDYLPEERVVPWKLERALKGNEARLKGEVIPYWSRSYVDETRPWAKANWTERGSWLEENTNRHHADWKRLTTEHEQKRRERLHKRLKQCPPKGNVFGLNAKAWRRRGWLDAAYPAIGRGAIVPTDWVGFGCTLLSARALSLAHFEGYDGGGTEDLFIGWHRWHPAGLRMAVTPHCPADHVIWQKKKGGDAGAYTLHHVYHETEGECVGHLRVMQRPWTPERHG